MPIIPAFDPSTGASGGPSGGGGGGANTFTWLDMPSKVYFVPLSPSPDPYPYTWDPPINGTGPYTYEVTYVGGGAASLTPSQWTRWDQSIRTIYMTTQPDTGTNGGAPNYFRVRAYDSLGNWGDTYIMFIHVTGANVVDILPEIVMDETDPPATYSFTVDPGWVGVNQVSPYGRATGSGIVTPSPMKDTLTARYMGPFTVDPAIGAVLWIHTAQESTPGGATIKWLCQPFRRRRGPMTRFDAKWQTVIDWDLESAGSQDPSAFIVPSAGSQVYEADFIANSFSEVADVTYQQQSAGVAAATEVAAFDATGLHCSMTCTTSNGRSIATTIYPRIANTHNAPTPNWPERWASIPSSDEVVVRWLGSMTVIGAAARVEWQFGGSGANGSFLRFMRGPVAGISGTPTTDIISLHVQHDAGTRSVLNVLATELDGVTIGIDHHIIGPRRIVVLYIDTGGGMPDLNSGINPYGGLQYWVTEGEGDTRAQAQLSHSGGVGQFDYSPTTQDSNPFSNQMVEPIFLQQLTLGNNGAADVQSRWTRIAIVHRPRSIRSWS